MFRISGMSATLPRIQNRNFSLMPRDCFLEQLWCHAIAFWTTFNIILQDYIILLFSRLHHFHLSLLAIHKHDYPQGTARATPAVAITGVVDGSTRTKHARASNVCKKNEPRGTTSRSAVNDSARSRHYVWWCWCILLFREPQAGLYIVATVTGNNKGREIDVAFTKLVNIAAGVSVVTILSLCPAWKLKALN
jgi:hypothetical protein